MKDLSFFARAAGTLSGAGRVAAVLLAVMLTMTAQTAWAQPWKVTLDSNESLGITKIKTASYDSGKQKYYYNLRPDEFTREGHSIIGWNTEPINTSSKYSADAMVYLTGDLTLYAIWDDTPNSYQTVTFNANGGSGSMDPVQVTGGSEYIIPANGFSRDGYVFLGWTTTANGSIAYRPGDIVTLVDDLTLYAVWAKASCNVSFYANGGSGSMDPVQVTGGTEYIIPANGFSRDGYVFLGWTTTANGSIVYRPGDIVTLVDDVTLYAVWGKVWAGSGTVDNPYQISEYTDLLQLAQYVNDGNDFSGKCFKLMNDISIPHTTDWNDAMSTENNFTAIGTDPVSEHWFMGTFDGDGHTISGIRIYKGGDDEFSDSFQGLFGLISGATIKNVTLADTRITGFVAVGGIVGGAFTSEVDNCHVLSNVAIHAVQENDQFGCGDHGGIAGSIAHLDDESKGSIISNCTSAATLTVKSGIKGDDAGFGSIAGNAVYSTLRDNLAIGATIPIVKNSGAIIGSCDNAVLQRNYYSGCTLGTTPTASGIGCNGADVTANDGAVKATILSETAAVPSPLSGKVVFRREFTGGKASTVCLPFGIDATQAAAAGKFFTFVGVDKSNPNDWIVTMQEEDPSNRVSGDLTANTPYLFKPTATGPVLFHGTADYDDTNLTTTDTEGWKFTGTYEKKTWASGQTRLYGFAAADFKVGGVTIDEADIGSFHRYNSGYCNAFRCYLWAPEPNAARGVSAAGSQLPDSMKVRILSASGEATAIGTLSIDNGQLIMDNYYDLNGRRLNGQPTKKGLYIHNGKTVVVK